MSKIWRVIDLIHWSESYFKDKAFQNPRSEIEWLLCSLLKCGRLDLYMRFEEPLSKVQLSTLRNWVKRRLKKEPLQYITGSCDFYGREFLVAPKVLIPRPETERLIEESIKSLESFQSPKILDIGTGSGCISIMLKSLYENANVTGVDISPYAIELSKENARLNNLDINFIESDLLKNVQENNFDLIVANLPYIPTNDINTLDIEVLNFEPLNALDGGDDDGTDIIKNLISQIDEKDVNDVEIFLEIDSRFSEKIIKLLNNYEEVELLKDLADKDRYIYARR